MSDFSRCANCNCQLRLDCKGIGSSAVLSNNHASASSGGWCGKPGCFLGGSDEY